MNGLNHHEFLRYHSVSIVRQHHCKFLFLPIFDRQHRVNHQEMRNHLAVEDFLLVRQLLLERVVDLPALLELVQRDCFVEL